MDPLWPLTCSPPFSRANSEICVWLERLNIQLCVCVLKYSSLMFPGVLPPLPHVLHTPFLLWSWPSTYPHRQCLFHWMEFGALWGSDFLSLLLLCTVLWRLVLDRMTSVMKMLCSLRIDEHWILSSHPCFYRQLHKIRPSGATLVFKGFSGTFDMVW